MTNAQEAGSKKNVVIVGSGIFGMSTALWMLKSGSYNVTVLDKCGILPAPDAASTDLNKIIRAGDYDDPGYAALSIEAIEEWRKPEWEETYHESGVMLLTTRDSELGKHAVSLAQANLASLNIEAQLLDDSQAIKRKLGHQVPTGDFENRVGYSNPIGGWAEASRAVEVGLKRIRQMGGLIRGGAEVVGLVKDGREVRGVVLDGGEEIKADLVVIAAGAWTPALFSSPGIATRFPEVVASGQTVAHIQLTPEEVETYSKIPVILNKDDGFYTFPPSAEGIFKFAQHGRGYTNPIQTGSSSTISVPRTKLTPGAEDGMIPLERVNLLRRYLADYYPELAKKDFMSTRLCWYCDTHSGDWLIDYHPDYENLFIATGGSGHAFKYAPIIGREILDVIEGKPNPTFADRWAFGYVGEREPRVDDIQVLKVAELARPQDLLVSA